MFLLLFLRKKQKYRGRDLFCFPQWLEAARRTLHLLPPLVWILPRNCSEIFFKRGIVYSKMFWYKSDLICEGKHQDCAVRVGQGQFCHGWEFLKGFKLWKSQVLKLQPSDQDYLLPGKIVLRCPRCWGWWECSVGQCDDLSSSKYPGLWISHG